MKWSGNFVEFYTRLFCPECTKITPCAFRSNKSFLGIECLECKYIVMSTVMNGERIVKMFQDT